MNTQQAKQIIAIFEDTDIENITKVMHITNTDKYLYTYKGVSYSVILNRRLCYQKEVEKEINTDDCTYSDWYPKGILDGQRLIHLSKIDSMLIKRTVLISMGYPCQMAKEFFFESEKTRIRVYWSHFR